MKKRLFLTLILSFVLLFSMCLCASAATKLTVNGVTKDVVAYNIKGNNYFKLRDIAHLVNGTEKQFDVTWDNEKKAINLKSNTAYSANDSISLDEIKDPVAQGSTSAIYKDGGKILAGAYNISGNNYFKLRDIAAIFDFAVVWDNATKTIGIDTSKPYEHPAPSSAFALNPEIVSYIGKTKAQMDALFGTPEPITTKYATFMGMVEGHGGDKYSNGLTVYYNAREEVKIVEKLEAPLSMMFFNCPAVLERPILDKAFYETNIAQEWDFKANIYGGTLEVYLNQGSITSDGIATLSNSTYDSEMTEIVYVGKEWANTANKNYARLYKEYFEKEFTTGRFSKKSDPYPFFDVYDFNKDGTPEMVGYDFNYDQGDGSFAGTYYQIFSIVNGKVVPIYTMGEHESICFYGYTEKAEYDLKIARRIDDYVVEFYTLDVKTGKLTYFSTIKSIYNTETGDYRVWLNGKQLTQYSDEYNTAFQNHSFNYPFNIGEYHYSDITVNTHIK